jgi:hypothetical protein
MLDTGVSGLTIPFPASTRNGILANSGQSQIFSTRPSLPKPATTPRVGYESVMANAQCAPNISKMSPRDAVLMGRSDSTDDFGIRGYFMPVHEGIASK